MPIPEGNDLGGLCEACHGFFCDGNVPIFPLKLVFL